MYRIIGIAGEEIYQASEGITQSIEDLEEMAAQLSQAAEHMSHLDQYLDQILPKLMDFGIRLLLALLCFFIGQKVIRLVRKIVRRSMERANADLGVIQFLDSLVKALLYMILALIIVSKFGVDTTSVIALAGSAGLTIGLALQGSLSNFAGGVLILLLRPFRVGDYIIQGNLEGTVSEIQMFYTRLLTVDNRMVVIPNGNLANNSLVNVTAQDKRQMDLNVGISYRSDLRAAKNLLYTMIEEEPRVMAEEAKMVVVSELADSAVMLKIRFWVLPSDYWPVYWEMMERIKLVFDANDIEIPYNQLDVTIRQQ